MDKSFDFGALLRKNEQKHKAKPAQFVSVAGGVQKRLATLNKIRKSTRLTTFDTIRDLGRKSSPDPATEAQLKIEHRRQQLEKWKAEKEQKKKEAAAQKKKPFLTGVAHASMKFPLALPPKPSTSGRVTRSQTAKNTKKTSPKHSRTTSSFAPKNALFRPPEIKTTAKVPVFIAGSNLKTRNNKKFTFEPLIPNTAKQTSKATRQVLTEIKNKTNTNKVGAKSVTDNKKITDRPPRLTRSAKLAVQSTSRSDVESSKINNRVKTPGPGKNKSRVFTPKQLVLESTSEEKSSSDNSSSEKSSKIKKSRKSIMASSNADKMSSDSSTSDLNVTVKSKTRKSLPRNFTPTSFKTDSSSDKLSSESEKSVAESKVRKSLPHTPMNRIPKSESSSEERLRSPKSPVDAVLTPQQIEIVKKLSPCVTLSRGKDNARREMRQKIQEGLLDDDTSDMENVDHFRQQLASEVNRLTETCDAWERLSHSTALPDAVEELVLAAVGQARLLVSQRLAQFGALVERCARPEPGSALVTPADLHGFWDMVFTQVEDVDLRFAKLEKLRVRNWAEDSPAQAQQKPRAQAKRTQRPVATSRIRDMIAAARKAKKQGELATLTVSGPEPENKTFEAGFFCVRSPVRSPLRSPATPGHQSLLKSVLSSEAKKASSTKNSTSFAMLRASLMSKNVECEGVAPLQLTPHMTPINLYATPGRSILKSANKSAKKSSKKSIKLVLFTGSDNENLESPQDDVEMFKSPMEGFEELASENATEHKPNSPTHATELFKSPVGVEELKSEQTDSGMSSMDVEKIEQKENKHSRRSKLTRQNAVEPIDDHVATRSQRKSLSTPRDAEAQKSTKRSARKKAEEAEDKTSRQSRYDLRKKLVEDSDGTEKTPIRSARKKALKEVDNIMEDAVLTPKRSTRRRKSAAQSGAT